MMRYLTQPLPDSETAWAYLHLANAIAMSGNAAGAVLAHEALENWLPGKSPRLSIRWPYNPASEDTPDAVYAGAEVRLLFLSLSVEFCTAYFGVWRNNAYLAKVDAALSEFPVTSKNREQRFFVLRTATTACEAAAEWERAACYVQQMHTLAADAGSETLRAELEAKALGHDIGLARRRKDEAAFTARVAEMTALLDATERREGGRVGWVCDERHDLACQLVWDRRHQLALPLWEANAAGGGQGNGWGWLMYAATVWRVTQDRGRTVSLLREARAHDDRDMVPEFNNLPEFADVREDTEFLQAIGRK